MITSQSQSQKMMIMPKNNNKKKNNYGSVSHRLNATTTAGSDTNQGYSSQEVPSFRDAAKSSDLEL